MKTPIDHYMDDALDETLMSESFGDGYSASRDVDEDGDPLTKDVAYRRRSFDPANEGSQPPGSGEIQIGLDGIEVELVQGIHEEDFQKTGGLAVRASTGHPERPGDWEELLRGGLQTALETQVVVFAVRGVSRACTHQLVRTRKNAAYHQQSQRAMYYGAKPQTRFAESVWRNPRARAAALRAIYFSHKAYETAVEEDISYQDARLLLLEGTTNFILCEYPLRTWLDTYAYRACSMFQWEIVHVFRTMGHLLTTAHPWLEPYVKISCEKTHGALDHEAYVQSGAAQKIGVHEQVAHACTYQGHERVEGQCDFPWARDSNRTFVPDQFIERKPS